MKLRSSVFLLACLAGLASWLVAEGAIADGCWDRPIERIDKKTGKVTYGNRQGVCWQREIERVDPEPGKLTYRHRAVPCRETP